MGHSEVARPRPAGHKQVFAAFDNVDSICFSRGQVVVCAVTSGKYDPARDWEKSDNGFHGLASAVFGVEAVALDDFFRAALNCLIKGHIGFLGLV